MFNISPIRTTLDQVKEGNLFSFTGNSDDIWIRVKPNNSIMFTYPDTMAVCVKLGSGEIKTMVTSAEVFKAFHTSCHQSQNK